MGAKVARGVGGGSCPLPAVRDAKSMDRRALAGGLSLIKRLLTCHFLELSHTRPSDARGGACWDGGCGSWLQSQCCAMMKEDNQFFEWKVN